MVNAVQNNLVTKDRVKNVFSLIHVNTSLICKSLFVYCFIAIWERNTAKWTDQLVNKQMILLILAPQ